ncbi:uncharacterized protein LOC126670314 [Mercurialis annua]|uniref:uncharacterized protein LOC126670314 n=1 Tax=Mercurialis annua TaxID=3986 RepID=UPI00215E2115|nr:uncharacterized protein LOC126670314 [Mercurialis annua]
MGCCVSTDDGSSRKSRKAQNFQVGSDQFLKFNKIQESRAPPSVEEETVKEILSVETPIFKNSFQETRNHVHKKIPIDQKPFLEEDADREKKIKNHHPVMIFRGEDTAADVSEQEVSEVCSVSVSETVSTTTFNNEKHGDDDEEEEVKQRVRKSPVARLPINRDFVPRKDRFLVGKSPNRRTEQSPDKRNNLVGRNSGCGGGGAMRLVQSKDSGNYHQAGRSGLRSDPNRKDPGERSGRRSRSPATNRSVMGRSPSVKRTNGSPGRFRTDPSGSMGGSSSNGGGRGGDSSTNESLENPLVSLECFIFL